MFYSKRCNKTKVVIIEKRELQSIKQLLWVMFKLPLQPSNLRLLKLTESVLNNVRLSRQKIKMVSRRQTNITRESTNPAIFIAKHKTINISTLELISYYIKYTRFFRSKTIV
jgi:hypothetical protein